MDSKVWGPHAWIFLHSVTMSYPENPTDRDKQNVYDFFQSLGNVIPCPVCKKHYQINLEQTPIKNNSRNELTYWLFDFHNKVNKSLDRKELSFDEFIKIYKNMYSPQPVSKKNIVKNILLVFLSVFILFLLMKLMTMKSVN